MVKKINNTKTINKKKKAGKKIVPVIEEPQLNGISADLSAFDGELKNILVRGAREHNLKNIDVDIPRNQLVVLTGLSGSGKSSLAFDTLYAEGQRRYIECLSAYARQFLGMLKKPDVDTIEGLSPAISIEQKSISHNPRSTVGTVTEIYDYLRLLYSKIGIQYCVDCHIPVEQKTLDQIVDDILENYNDKSIQILTPLVRARKGHYRDLFEQLIKQGFTKVRVDGEIKHLEENMQVSRYQIHDIELVIDRLLVSPQQEHRINESSELALQKGEGTMLVLWESSENVFQEKLYSTEYSCPKCSKSYQPLAPNMFSFNSPYGACPTCEGLGELKDFNMDLIIPDKSKSVLDGALTPLGKQKDTWLWEQVLSFLKHNNIDPNTPLDQIPPEIFEGVLYGDKTEKIPVSYKFSGGNQITYYHKFTGLIPNLKHHYDNTSSPAVRKNIEAYMSVEICPKCNGGRLKPESLSVFVNENSIDQIVRMNISKANDYFSKIKSKLTDRQLLISNLIIKEIGTRLRFLADVGLSYLSINRSIRSLSGGESQRIRLAAQIGTELVGIMYVLDEPSIGLHQHDNDKLINTLKKLRDLGNTVVVVEHDKAMMEQSDYLIDLGPGAGVNGGKLVLAAPSDTFKHLTLEQLNSSLTAQYLTNFKKINVPEIRRNGSDKALILEGCLGNNLKNLTVRIPLGKLVCITGKSGSGKSTLINDTLYPILSNYFFNSKKVPLQHKTIHGIDLIDKVIEIDQSPIGRTPRSNPATYTGIFTLIRDFYAMLPDSKVRGYKIGRFSFNVKGGRCEVCEGAGIKKIEMNFLPEVYVTCDECKGKRYNKETLTVFYKGKSIADVLEMTVEEAIDFFKEIPRLKNKLQTLYDVGLTYITLGQQAPTLSGGEAQRVKLATELSKISTGKTLYLLDEPTTGLHFEDILILLRLLDRLVEKGNTVIVIEHNMDVIKYADWIIDLGPEGGDDGGEIVAEGTPEEIVKSKRSYTARYLVKELE